MIQGIKYISLAETTGYGLSATDYVRALIAEGVPVTWHPLIFDRGRYLPAPNVDAAMAAMTAPCNDEALRAAFRAPLDYDTVLAHVTPEHWPGAIETGKRMIGYTVWETDALPLHWPSRFAGYERILTPSVFSRDVFAAETSVPVVVVPHLPRAGWPSDGDDARAAFRRRFGIAQDDFLFYSVNTWILRKAMWLTLHAYLLAFEHDERVAFIVKTSSHGESEDSRWGPSRRLFDRVMSNYEETARVVFVNEDLGHDDIGMLHLASDAYVSLTRSEGFGLGAFDAAAAGNPVIMTGWGGQLDFLPAEHACLVDYELRQVEVRLGNHRPRPQAWAHADLDDAMAWMRRLYENPDEARSRGSALKAHVEERFDERTITRRLIEALYG